MTQNKKISWGGVTSYESPLVKTLEIASEGLLCASTGAIGIADWESDGESLDF